MPNNETYLGEGVYASFDTYKIDLRGQDSTTRIALEPLVFDALLEYAKTKAKWELMSEGSNVDQALATVEAFPELLEACRAIVDNWESGDLAAAANMCSAAIEKATKETV